MAGSDRLVDLVFEKEQPESVDFEIAFTALLATATITSLNAEARHSLIITLSALALLVLTLVRRMGVIGRYANEESILNITVRPIELLTIVCVFQISITVLSSVDSWETGTVLVSSVLCVTVLIIVVVQELVFGDYRIWWGSAFFTKGLAVQKGSDESNYVLYEILLSALASLYFEFAYLVLKQDSVIPDKDIEKWNTLRNFVKDFNDRQRSHPSAGKLFLSSGVIVVIGYGSVSWLLSLFDFPLLAGLLLLIGIMAIRHLIGFWYLAYGSQTLSRFLQGNTHHLATMAVYTSVCYWMFFMP
jgi:hypothetical protein